MSKSTIEQKFWRKVEKTDACWIWIAGKDRHGYGAFGFRGSVWRSHRVAWTFANGEIPENAHVCHSCDVRECVNPAHLWLGTNADNTSDKVRKGRHKFILPPLVRGKDHHNSSLTEQAVRLIRADSAKSSKEWATTLGVSASTIRNARQRRSWRHI